MTDALATPTLHHVGFVVASIDKSVEGFARSVGLSWNGRVFADPIQRVRVTFLGDEGTPQIELVEPDGADAPVQSFLAKGGGLHHVCYEVNDLEAQLRAQRQNGGITVRPPAPAVAFGGRRIAWSYTRERLLVEYLERRSGA